MLDTDVALFDLSEVVAPWTPICNSTGQLCRDCGRPNSWGAGGARPGLGCFQLCETCCALDGWNELRDGAPNCSHWGVRTDPAAHDALVAKRERRRARWTAAHAC
jgi:hypothetical protein